MKILLDFNTEVEREYFKTDNWDWESTSLHQDSNDNGVRIVNIATSKNLVKSTMLTHRNIHKYIWTYPAGNTHTQVDLHIDR